MCSGVTQFMLNPLLSEAFTVIVVFPDIRSWPEQPFSADAMTVHFVALLIQPSSTFSIVNICLGKVKATQLKLIDSKRSNVLRRFLDSKTNGRNVFGLQEL